MWRRPAVTAAVNVCLTNTNNVRFLIHISHMDLCDYYFYYYNNDNNNNMSGRLVEWLAGWLIIWPSCIAKLWRWTLATNFFFFFFLPNIVILAMLIGATDFFNIIPLWPWLRSQGWCKANLVGLIFLHSFQVTRWKLMWCLSNSTWKAWYYFWARFIETVEITDALLTV